MKGFHNVHNMHNWEICDKKNPLMLQTGFFYPVQRNSLLNRVRFLMFSSLNNVFFCSTTLKEELKKCCLKSFK